MTVLRVSEHTANKAHKPCPDCGVAVQPGERYRRHVQLCPEWGDLESFARHIDCAKSSKAFRDALETDEGFYWWIEGLEALADMAGPPIDEVGGLWSPPSTCCEHRSVLIGVLDGLWREWRGVFDRIEATVERRKGYRLQLWLVAFSQHQKSKMEMSS